MFIQIYLNLGRPHESLQLHVYNYKKHRNDTNGYGFSFWRLRHMNSMCQQGYSLSDRPTSCGKCAITDSQTARETSSLSSIKQNKGHEVDEGCQFWSNTLELLLDYIHVWET